MLSMTLIFRRKVYLIIPFMIVHFISLITYYYYRKIFKAAHGIFETLKKSQHIFKLLPSIPTNLQLQTQMESRRFQKFATGFSRACGIRRRTL